MLSALLMFRRVAKAFRHAVREEDFPNVFGAGVLLVVIGTVTYSLGSGWNVVDALYIAVATLTTTSVSDPDLVLQDGWLNRFTVLHLLVGIGILVEILRRKLQASRTSPEQLLRAVSSVYGLDIDEGNVAEARERMLEVADQHIRTRLILEPAERCDLLLGVWRVICLNVKQADTLNDDVTGIDWGWRRDAETIGSQRPWLRGTGWHIDPRPAVIWRHPEQPKRRSRRAA
jgi:hypothetical protein